MSRTPPPPSYGQRLKALAGALRDAPALAELQENAAGLLRGKLLFSGPPLHKEARRRRQGSGEGGARQEK